MRNRYLAIFFISCVAIFLASGCSKTETQDIETETQDIAETQNIEEQIKELEKKIQRAADVEAIKVLMVRMQWTFGLDTNVKKTPGLCFGQADGYIYGNFMKRTAMFERSQGQASGESIPGEVHHMLTTPIIEIAEDGQTAKAYWYTPGVVNNGWMYENYACDFVKEDGEWKTWHRLAMPEFSSAPLKSWTDIEEGPGGGETRPSGKDIQVAFEQWSPERLPQNNPKAPVPYKTFSETFSYCPPMPEDLEEMLWREDLMF